MEETKKSGRAITVSLNVSMTPEQKERCREQARKARRKMADWARQALERACAEDDR